MKPLIMLVIREGVAQPRLTCVQPTVAIENGFVFCFCCWKGLPCGRGINLFVLSCSLYIDALWNMRAMTSLFRHDVFFIMGYVCLVFQHVLDYVYVLVWLVIAALFGTVATTWSQKVSPIFHKEFNYPTFNKDYWQRTTG